MNDAVAALRAGQAVILPTDTVYGLCVLPGNEDVLYELKQRDRSKPIALIAADVDALAAPSLDRAVLERYFPGPYTLVFESAGVRIPNLPPEAAEVVREVGVVAATSANLSGGPDPRRVEDIPEEIRAAVRRDRRRRRAAGYAVDGHRPARRRAGRPPPGRRAVRVSARRAAHARLREACEAPSFG